MNKAVDFAIVLGVVIASVFVAAGFVLALPGRMLEQTGKDLGYRLWKID